MRLRQGFFLCALLFDVTTKVTTCNAEVFRLDTGQAIPGTEGIWPGPGVVLDNRNLEYADLSRWARTSSGVSALDLTGAQFNFSNLSKASFYYANLTNASFISAHLADTNFGLAALKDADLSGAIITGANFGSTTHQGFTKEQLYSTASYQAKDLRGIKLNNSLLPFGPFGWPGPVNDLTAWNFSGQNLTNADLSSALLIGADLTGADLSGAMLRYSVLSNADFTGAVITGANLMSGNQGITREQLVSTASYQAKNLQNVRLSGKDMAGWDLSGQDFSGAELSASKLTNTDFTGAIVAGADLSFTALTKEQLYSTASYQAKDLHEIRLSGIGLPFERSDLSGWDFRDQNLAGAVLEGARLINADLRGANLANATLQEADLTGSNLSGADLRGAQGLQLRPSIVRRNTILTNGMIARLELASGESLLIRDDDELIVPPPRGIGSPRQPIPVTITDGVSMAEGSTLTLRFETDSWDSVISFVPNRPIELAGALELTFAAGVDPATQVGRTLRVFDWTGVSPIGEFEILSPYVWDTDKLYSTGEVTLMAIPALPGDFNQDGSVDAADYVVWRKGLGTIYIQEDYNIWRANFGERIPASGAIRSFSDATELLSAVPEPETPSIVLIVVAMASVACRASCRRPS
jgi:uncharacterized protein YjbI with pentapeptide repeats